jgi:hypothetical protein
VHPEFPESSRIYGNSFFDEPALASGIDVCESSPWVCAVTANWHAIVDDDRWFAAVCALLFWEGFHFLFNFTI